MPAAALQGQGSWPGNSGCEDLDDGQNQNAQDQGADQDLQHAGCQDHRVHPKTVPARKCPSAHPAAAEAAPATTLACPIAFRHHILWWGNDPWAIRRPVAPWQRPVANLCESGFPDIQRQTAPPRTRRTRVMGDIAFHLNGTPVTVTGQPATRTLLDWLREDRGLTGTRKAATKAIAVPAP